MKIDIISKEPLAPGSQAYRIKKDFIINTLANIKKMLKTYQGNELYVSKQNLEDYKKRRKEFEKSLMWASVLVALIWFTGILSILNGANLNQAINSLISLILITLLVLFAVVYTRYIPDIHSEPETIGDVDGKENNDKGQTEKSG